MAGPAFTLRSFRPDDGAWVVAAHARIYAAEEGYDASFADLVGGIVADFVATPPQSGQAGWIAEGEAGPVGCIFCVPVDDKTAKLRMFLVMPEGRGQGLGRHLLTTCMAYAKGFGFTRMTLWTHESHRAACALYAQTGWRLVSSVPGHEFGVPVVDQEWDIDL